MLVKLPVAVLFVSAETNEVVFANHAAREMFAMVKEGAVCKLSALMRCDDKDADIEKMMRAGDGMATFWLDEQMCAAPCNAEAGIRALGWWAALDDGYMFVVSLNDGVSQEVATAKSYSFDPLTGLPNREVFLDRVASAIKSAARTGEPCMALLFIDLDKFKPINDTYGHAAGDVVLKEIAARLKACLRGSDIVARHGGDEFVALLPKLRDKNDSMLVAQRMLDACGEPVIINGVECRLGASIGVALWPKDGINCTELVEAADTAMYQGKHNGKNTIRYFDPLMHEEARNRANTEVELREALRTNQFVLHYQPQFCTKTGGMQGVEALIRWNHPRRGMVPPVSFIRVAEETNLIGRIGDWVIEEAAMQCARWVKEGLSLKVAINLSARQFVDDLPMTVLSAINKAGIDPKLFEVELTESFLLSDIEKARRIIGQLRSIGVRVSIDDFGTGYSSLSYLRSIEFDTLKIDKSYVGANGGEFDERMIRTILAIANSLGLNTLAEGVESEDHLLRLRSLGCESWQGYLRSGAVSASKVLEFFRNNELQKCKLIAAESV